jgi:hypothetical protein
MGVSLLYRHAVLPMRAVLAVRIVLRLLDGHDEHDCHARIISTL